MIDEGLVVQLKKNKLDLQHGMIMQERGIFLGLVFGYPFTVLNLIFASQFYLNDGFLLGVLVLLIPWGYFINRFLLVSKRAVAKQDEIDLLVEQFSGEIEE